MNARFLVALVLAGCGSSAGGAGQSAARPHDGKKETPAFTWEVPAGWKSETIPFPLEFAPDIPHRGVEELRFAPGFFEPAAPGYWTYAFAWVVSEAGALDMPALAGQLTSYFRGLTSAVAEGKSDLPSLDLGRIEARIGPDGRGSVVTFDAFGDGREVQLDVTVAVRPCGAGKAILFTAMPHGRPPLSPSPREVAASFRCRQAVKSSRGGSSSGSDIRRAEAPSARILVPAVARPIGRQLDSLTHP